jgi:hypothetical protein
MWYRPLNDEIESELLLAGQTAPAGIYRETGSGRWVQLTEAGVLPASFDGRIACYVPVHTWAQAAAARPLSRIGAEPSHTR